MQHSTCFGALHHNQSLHFFRLAAERSAASFSSGNTAAVALHFSLAVIDLSACGSSGLDWSLLVHSVMDHCSLFLLLDSRGAGHGQHFIAADGCSVCTRVQNCVYNIVHQSHQGQYEHLWPKLFYQACKI
jgi:hypothetical protein